MGKKLGENLGDSFVQSARKALKEQGLGDGGKPTASVRKSSDEEGSEAGKSAIQNNILYYITSVNSIYGTVRTE